MKLVVVSESPADEAAVKVLVDAVLGAETDLVVPAQRSRGWPNVRDLLPATIKRLYFGTDADGIIVVVDSDDSPLHEVDHDEPQCRLCQLRRIRQQTLGELAPRDRRPALKIAIGLAAPAIEAWLLWEKYPQATEAAWVEFLAHRSDGPRIRRWQLDLKERLYGSTRPSPVHQREVATAEATRIAADIYAFRAHFPAGFGALMDDLQQW